MRQFRATENRAKNNKQVIQIFEMKYIFSILIMFSLSCSKSKNSELEKNIGSKKIELNKYNVKDTISEIRISHKEGTEYLDAYIESGKLYISKSIMAKIEEENKIRQNGFEPSGFDLYLTGKNNMSEELFGKDYFSPKVGSEYIVKGKVVGFKHSSFLFRVDSYKKLETK
jgi:hypothetical protein